MKKLLFSLMAVGTICLHAQQKVGVNTETPEATLHVATGTDSDGNMIIRETPEGTALDEPLVWNSDTGEVSVMNQDDLPFYLVHFTVECSKNQDYVADFDTKIPVNGYQLVLTSAYPQSTFIEKERNLTLDIRHVSENYGFKVWDVETGAALSNQILNPVREVFVFKKNNTWHIKADYPNARPNKWYNQDYSFTWHFYALAIKASYVNTIPKQKGEAVFENRVVNGVEKGAPVYSFPNLISK
ncbi:hypothetical protein [Ornithobacterium rhinotracheale]|uniref:hypothetical protein n=1 Tax=Ornithobacterium rhinotracheale TaxID=28251 RepID=UPI0040350B24